MCDLAVSTIGAQGEQLSVVLKLQSHLLFVIFSIPFEGHQTTAPRLYRCPYCDCSLLLGTAILYSSELFSDCGQYRQEWEGRGTEIKRENCQISITRRSALKRGTAM